MNNTTNTVRGGAVSVKVMEPFGFKDGVRLAWVWWTLGDGRDRYCARVEPLTSGEVFKAFVGANR